MNGQGSMFDQPSGLLPHQGGPSLEASRAARDEAMARVDDHAEQEWKDRALEAVLTIALRQTEFGSDEVWAFVEMPREGRALGPVMMRARRLGWIEATDRFRPTPVVKHHAAPTRIWRSLVAK